MMHIYRAVRRLEELLEIETDPEIREKYREEIRNLNKKLAARMPAD